MTPLTKQDPRVGTTLADRYRIDALIGEGGMGKVYAAEHVLMKKRLAVKVLRRELTSVPEVVARFEREAMAAANIDHPNVASATDFGKLSDGSVFLVLEFVQGKSLRDEIAEGPLPVERALHIGRQIAAGLGSAHGQRIVHRDLKPENVMLVDRAGDRDFVKVLDFGIAKVPIAEVPEASNDHPITKAGMVFGTPEYMAPEQALGQAVDGRADLYSLGVILFEMLAGTRPFSSLSPVGILGQQLANPPPTFGERAPGIRVPPAVEQLVHRLLARDREQRFPSASAVVTALSELLLPAQGRAGYRFTLADGSPSTGLRPELLPPPDHVGASTGDPRTSAFGPALGKLPSPPPLADDLPSIAEGKRRSFGASVRAGVRAAMSSVVPPAHVLRDKLPSRLRESLRPVQTRTLVLATGIFGVLIVGLLLALTIVLVRILGRTGPQPLPVAAAPAPSPTTRTPPAANAVPAGPSAVASAVQPIADRASTEEIESATVHGAASLEILAKKYPLDPQPLAEAARAWVKEKDYLKATGAVARALALDSSLSRDDRIATVLFQTAQSRVSADPAFALLQGPLGARGAEIQWDLAAEDAIKPWVRQRAGQWLRTPEFRKLASPPLLLAADLRTAPSCEAAHALLARAREIGDERSLIQLNAWKKTNGCGARKTADCMPCLRQDSALNDAVTAIVTRQKAK